VQEKQQKMREKIMKKNPNDPNMLEEYNFSNGVKGKYAKKFADGTNVVVIAPDVAKYFPDHNAVNDALRSLAGIIAKQEKSFIKEIFNSNKIFTNFSPRNVTTKTGSFN